MKESIIYIAFVLIISSCCTDVYFKSEERFWSENYNKGDELIFESNNGDLDTIKITDVIIKIPSGECNPMVSNYDKEFVRVDYQIKKDTFKIHNGWFIQHSAEPEGKPAIPVLRFLNMEYNQWEGSLKESKIELPNNENRNVFVFDKSNCGMNYNQKFGLINLKWNKDVGLISYENSEGEIWVLK
jgi:hypothetical protein